MLGEISPSTPTKQHGLWALPYTETKSVPRLHWEQQRKRERLKSTVVSDASREGAASASGGGAGLARDLTTCSRADWLFFGLPTLSSKKRKGTSRQRGRARLLPHGKNIHRLLPKEGGTIETDMAGKRLQAWGLEVCRRSPVIAPVLIRFGVISTGLGEFLPEGFMFVVPGKEGGTGQIP